LFFNLDKEEFLCYIRKSSYRIGPHFTGLTPGAVNTKHQNMKGIGYANRKSSKAQILPSYRPVHLE
jgi:hypothetical protein